MLWAAAAPSVVGAAALAVRGAPSLPHGTPRCASPRCEVWDSVPQIGGPKLFGDPPEVVAKVEADDVGLTLLVADSLVAKGGRGLYARLQDGVDEVILPSGITICGYCRGKFTDRADGDKAVPFAFSDAQRLVMWRGELRPLQAAVAESGATSILGHKLQRYGPNGMAVMVSIDEAFTERILVPDEEDEEDTTRLGLPTVGQFVNDLAFDNAASLQAADAMWEYERRSEAANVLTLAWDLQEPCCAEAQRSSPLAGCSS